MGNDEATLKPMTIRSACNVATTAGTAGQAEALLGTSTDFTSEAAIIL